MTGVGIDDPVLARVRTALEQMYGDRIERVALFGARVARRARIRIMISRCFCAT